MLSLFDPCEHVRTLTPAQPPACRPSCWYPIIRSVWLRQQYQMLVLQGSRWIYCTLSSRSVQAWPGVKGSSGSNTMRPEGSRGAQLRPWPCRVTWYRVKGQHCSIQMLCTIMMMKLVMALLWWSRLSGVQTAWGSLSEAWWEEMHTHWSL